MIKREASSAIRFRHWLMANPMFTASFEIKDSRGKKSIPYSAIEEHQINYAVAIKDSKKGVLIRVQGTNGEPDYIYMRNAPAFFVIFFPDAFYIIPVDNLIFHKEKNKKSKSITQVECDKICTKSIILK